MSVQPPSSSPIVPRAAEAPARTAKQVEDRDAWAANLINEMRRAARAQGGPRSL